MALAFTRTASVPIANQRINYGFLAFDNSYTTGGLAYTPALFGFNNKVRQIFVLPQGGFVFDVDTTALKILVRGIAGAGGAAAAGTNALSMKSGVLNQEAATAFAVGLPEVGNTTDLSVLLATVSVIVIGVV